MTLANTKAQEGLQTSTGPKDKMKTDLPKIQWKLFQTQNRDNAQSDTDRGTAWLELLWEG